MVTKRALPIVTVVAALIFGINVAVAQPSLTGLFGPGQLNPADGFVLYQAEVTPPGQPVTPGAVTIDEKPFSIDAAFRWTYLTDTDGFDFNAFGGEISFTYGFSIPGDNLFEIGLVTFIAGTDLDFVDAVFWDIQAMAGVEFPVQLENDMVFSFIVNGRIGFGLLHTDSDTGGTSDLYYLPVEASLGPRLYFNNQQQYVYLAGVIGGHIGLDSAAGPTPDDLFDIGVTLGLGTRF